jgi:hypothetical protein
MNCCVSAAICLLESATMLRFTYIAFLVKYGSSGHLRLFTKHTVCLSALCLPSFLKNRYILLTPKDIPFFVIPIDQLATLWMSPFSSSLTQALNTYEIVPVPVIA